MMVRIKPYLGEDLATLSQDVGRNQTFMTTYGLMNSWRDYRSFRPESRSYNALNMQLPAIGHSARPETRGGETYQSLPAHLQFYKSNTMGPEDFKGTFNRFQNKGMNPTFPLFGTPRMRYGRAGGSWRHVKEVVQARGSNTIFVDGNPKMDDNSRIIYKDVEYGNVIQPSATCKAPIKTSREEAYRPRKQSPVYSKAMLFAMKNK